MHIDWTQVEHSPFLLPFFGFAGKLSVHTLTTTRLAETWIHTGDVADALGTTLAPTDRLRHVARLAWRTLPYAFARGGRELHGPVAFDLRGPDGDSWDFVPDTDPVTTIHGDALYHTEATSTVTSSAGAKKTDVMTMDNKWLGVCKAGQKVGVPSAG